jgi:undecaprenyl diphosphate synthase
MVQIAQLTHILGSVTRKGRGALRKAREAFALSQLRQAAPGFRKPVHAAFILDGNRRYAREEKLPTCRMGHEIGARRFHQLIELCHRHGVPNLSVYAFSIENFKRSPVEVAAIFDIVRLTCEGMLDPDNVVNRVGCRLRVIGDRDLVPPEVRAAIDRAEAHTARHTAMTVFMSVAYDGREEIVRAARRCLTAASEGAEGITMEEMARNMYVRAHGCDVPPVDLVVRTGGANRLSSFLMWDSSHAEIHFDPTLWPDFGEYHFLRALSVFHERVQSSQAIDMRYWSSPKEMPAAPAALAA